MYKDCVEHRGLMIVSKYFVGGGLWKLLNINLCITSTRPLKSIFSLFWLYIWDPYVYIYIHTISVHLKRPGRDTKEYRKGSSSSLSSSLRQRDAMPQERQSRHIHKHSMSNTMASNRHSPLNSKSSSFRLHFAVIFLS
jgi:hypothetical protein